MISKGRLTWIAAVVMAVLAGTGGAEPSGYMEFYQVASKGPLSDEDCRNAGGTPADFEPKEWQVLQQGIVRNKKTGRIGVTYGVKSLSNIVGVTTFNVCEF